MMIRDSIVRLLAGRRLADYVVECRTAGRIYIPPARRREFSALYPQLKAMCESSARLTAHEYMMLNFAADFCHSEQFLAAGRPARYTIYTNLALIDAYIGAKSRRPMKEVLERCRSAIALLVLDWIEFERTALERDGAGHEVGLGLARDNVVNRIAKLREFSRGVSAEVLPFIRPIESQMPPNFTLDWEYFACAEDGAVGFVHATCMPTSRYHDEYLFLRTIHITEVCFWAMIVGIRGAAAYAKRQDWRGAIACMKEANVFASYLLPLYQIFKTMPPESFKLGFREDTGDSSAIQSVKFQTLDLLVRGYSPAKLAALEEIPEHQLVTRWLPDPSDTLPGMHAAAMKAPDRDRLDLCSECEALDRHLRAWRGDHLGIVRTYLGVNVTGTGGQSFDYLQKTMRDPRGIDTAVSEPGEIRDDWIFVPVDRVRCNASLGFLRASGVRKSLLVASVEARKDAVLGQLRDRGDEIDARLKGYDLVFAKFDYEFPLHAQKQRLLARGFGTHVVANLVLALEMKTGVLMGIHQLDAIVHPIRVCKAASGTLFQAIDGSKRRLKEGEVYFADGKSIFASYFQGPDSRTLVSDPLTSPDQDGLGDLLCLVMGAPDMPDDVFRDAFASAQEWLQSIAVTTAHTVARVAL